MASSVAGSGARSRLRGPLLQARPRTPSLMAIRKPPSSWTSSGATEATVARSIVSASPGSTLAPIALHQPRLVALPVAGGGGLALDVDLLALGERQLELRHAPVVPVELGGDKRQAVALDGADQPVDLAALEQQLSVPPRLVVEVRAGLGVGRDVGVHEHDLGAFHRRIALGDVGLAVAKRLHLRPGQGETRLEGLLEEVVVPGAPVLRDRLAGHVRPGPRPA